MRKVFEFNNIELHEDDFMAFWKEVTAGVPNGELDFGEMAVVDALRERVVEAVDATPPPLRNDLRIYLV